MPLLRGTWSIYSILKRFLQPSLVSLECYAALAGALENGSHNEAVAKFTLPLGEARRVQPMYFVSVPLRPQNYFGGVLKLVRHYGSGGFHAGDGILLI